MKVLPLIYSRILKDDYPDGFLARPADLDVSAALKYVIPAMENIMHVGGIRHAVFPAGDYLIYGGVACVAGDLVKRILRSRTIGFPYEEYQADKAGRPLIFFIGFAMRKNELARNKLPDIDLYRTYEIYLSYLAKQWRKDKAVTDISEELELKARPYTMEPAPQSLVAGGKHILRDYCEDDFQDAIDYYFAGMAWGRGGDFSFLSYVLPDDAARSPFANISAYNCSPEECVRRMGTSGTSASYVPTVEHGGSELRTNNILNRKIAGVPDGGSSTGAGSIDTGKKKTASPPRRRLNPVATIVGVAIAAIIALLLFFLVKPKKAEANQRIQSAQGANDAAVLEQSSVGAAALRTGEIPEAARAMTIREKLEAPMGKLPLNFLAETAEELLEMTDNAPLENTGSRI